MAAGKAWARALAQGPMGLGHSRVTYSGPARLRPGPGHGPMGPPVAMYFHKERRFLHHICTLKRIIGDEFLSNFGEFLSEVGDLSAVLNIFKKI